MTREFKVILLGATGITGSGCADYLAMNYPALKWAMAGRSEAKLSQLKNNLVKLYPSASSVDIILGDSSDRQSLVNMVKRTDVVISTVGPFAKYGYELVDACVQEKTHYVDSTGETNFIHNIIGKHHEKAKADGTFIIPSAGYDSVPSDLGAFLLAMHFREQYDADTENIHLAVDSARAKLSGGTLHSALGFMEVPSNTLKNWQAFYIMEMPNIRYVLRSSSLLNYGGKFQYSEGMSHRYLIFALLSNILVGAAFALLILPHVRMILKYLVPQGSGPSRDEIKKGFFNMRVVGSSGVDPKGKRHKAILQIVGRSDPGYGETPKMVVESALCLALEKDSLKNASNGRMNLHQGGVVTVASALGLVLVERLRNHAKMVLEIVPSKDD